MATKAIIEAMRPDATKVSNPNMKAYLPLLHGHRMRRLFKTKKSAIRYARAVKERYLSIKYYEELDDG